MQNEQNTKWIGRIAVLVLTLGVVVWAWMRPKPKEGEGMAAPEKVRHLIGLSPERHPEDDSPEGVSARLKDVLEIVLHHQPGNAESERLLESLGKVRVKYEKQVKLTRVDEVAKPPAEGTAKEVAKPPSVVMKVAGRQVFAFEGVWPLPRIERKVEEILAGLKRCGKDWRPEVKGMQRQSNPPDSNNPRSR